MSLGFSQFVLPASDRDGSCSVLSGSHVEREGNSPARHIPACEEPCLQSCPELVECWQEKGSIPEKVGLSLRTCIPTWKFAVVCRAAVLPVSFPLCSG